MICYQPHMVEPSRRTSRFALAGGIAAAIALTGTGFVLGRGASETPEPVITPSSRPSPVVKAAPPPAIPPPLGRADLVAAATAAADDLAAGRTSTTAAALTGQRFELRLPFGCAGPSTIVNTPLGWRYDEQAETLRVRVLPVLWEVAAWTSLKMMNRVEAIEGFWIPRPWTTSEACPSTSYGVSRASDVPDEQTLGIAQFHLAGSSRVGRRDGEAFEAVQKIARDALDLSRGLRLRLHGEITAAPGNGALVCRALAGADRRPTCLISVSLSDVAIENSATGATIATWDVSRRRALDG